MGGPKSGLKLSPYDIVYGRPCLAPGGKGESVNIQEESKLKQYVQQISPLLMATHKFASSRSTLQLETLLHPFRTGEQTF
jgi:hypothetical protein